MAVAASSVPEAAAVLAPVVKLVAAAAPLAVVAPLLLVVAGWGPELCDAGFAPAGTAEASFGVCDARWLASEVEAFAIVVRAHL